MPFTQKEEEKFEIYKQVHLRKNEDLSDEEKLTKLHKKRRSKWIQLVINVGIVLLFVYMYTGGLTTFADWFYYLLFGVFALNVLLLLMQKRQIDFMEEYLEHRMKKKGP